MAAPQGWPQDAGGRHRLPRLPDPTGERRSMEKPLHARVQAITADPFDDPIRVPWASVLACPWSTSRKLRNTGKRARLPMAPNRKVAGNSRRVTASEHNFHKSQPAIQRRMARASGDARSAVNHRGNAIVLVGHADNRFVSALRSVCVGPGDAPLLGRRVVGSRARWRRCCRPS